jgi:hypothetical protein
MLVGEALGLGVCVCGAPYALEFCVFLRSSIQMGAIAVLTKCFKWMKLESKTKLIL